MLKTKDQKTFEFVQSLQAEWIISDIRRKIYKSYKDRNYYKKVMDLKKQKIEDICLRNSMSSIFTDDELRLKMLNSIYGWGVPKFYYSSIENQLEIRKFDIVNYFSNEADVMIRLENDSVKGIIVDNSQIDYQMFKGSGEVNEDTMGLKVKIRGEQNSKMALLKNIRRIL